MERLVPQCIELGTVTDLKKDKVYVLGPSCDTKDIPQEYWRKTLPGRYFLKYDFEDKTQYIIELVEEVKEGVITGKIEAFIEDYIYEGTDTFK